MSSPQRIGILGGTFDPIHRTHLDIARAAKAFADLDKVLFVVASIPPHKRGGVSAEAEDRFALVEAAVAGEPDFEVSRIELERGGPSYMVDTLRQLHELYPDAEFYLILGQDAAVDLPGWREPQAILEQCRLLVLAREDCAPMDDPLLAGHYDIVPFSPSALSSTRIREALAEGEAVDALLPEGVVDEIAQRGLYHDLT